MPQISIDTARSCEMINITSRINALIPQDLQCGICHIFCTHTTAALTVNENADPDVKHDLLCKLNMLMPVDESFYRHCEGNSAAHLKSSLLGVSLMLPVKNGKLDLGIWQGVYFCEFDGPRQRRVQLRFLNAFE